MDTSPEYIDMCRKATELQEMWKLTLGDWFYYETSNSVTCIGEFVKVGDVYNATGHGNWKIGKNNSIWLPRIDQQIELSDMGWGEFSKIAMGISSSWKGLSFEMCGLMGLMYHVHRKEWRSIEWRELY